MRGDVEGVARWARRGLVPVDLVPLDPWTAVLPAGGSRGQPPYEDALTVLAGRPAGRPAGRLRPAVGLFAVRGAAVVTVHPRGWRAVQRWVVWRPREAVVPTRELPLLRPRDLAVVCGVTGPGADQRIREVLREPAGDALTVLRRLLDVLALPGADLLTGRSHPHGMPGHQQVEPESHHVARFNAMVRDDARLRAELEEG